MPPPSGDHVVMSRAGDRLGRAPLAEAIAAQLAGADPESGVVFGMTGPWGSGKTSLLRMVKESLQEDHGGWALFSLALLSPRVRRVVAHTLPESSSPSTSVLHSVGMASSARFGILKTARSGVGSSKPGLRSQTSP